MFNNVLLGNSEIGNAHGGAPHTWGLKINEISIFPLDTFYQGSDVVNGSELIRLEKNRANDYYSERKCSSVWDTDERPLTNVDQAHTNSSDNHFDWLKEI